MVFVLTDALVGELPAVSRHHAAAKRSALIAHDELVDNGAAAIALTHDGDPPITIPGPDSSCREGISRCEISGFQCLVACDVRHLFRSLSLLPTIGRSLYSDTAPQSNAHIEQAFSHPRAES